jgi:hypothetical protein
MQSYVSPPCSLPCCQRSKKPERRIGGRVRETTVPVRRRVDCLARPQFFATSYTIRIKSKQLQKTGCPFYTKKFTHSYVIIIALFICKKQGLLPVTCVSYYDITPYGYILLVLTLRSSFVVVTRSSVPGFEAEPTRSAPRVTPRNMKITSRFVARVQWNSGLGLCLFGLR